MDMTTEDQLRAKLATAEAQVAMMRDALTQTWAMCESLADRKIPTPAKYFRLEATKDAALSSEQPPILEAVEAAALALEPFTEVAIAFQEERAPKFSAGLGSSQEAIRALELLAPYRTTP